MYKLDALEEEFLKITGRTQDGSQTMAKAAASLCREKYKEVIKLAQETEQVRIEVPRGNSYYEDQFKYTEQEILDTLNKKP